MNNICLEKIKIEPLLMSEEKTQNINRNTITNTENRNSGGRGTIQERREKFRIVASRIHHNKYDYSEYVNNNTKIKITCPQHGLFLQTPHNHLHGEGCPKCGVISRSSCRASSVKDFIKKATEIHKDKYDYSKFVYVRSFIKGIVVCKIHGEFTQTPNNHLMGAECPLCFGTFKKTTDEFIERATQIHRDRYNYSKVDYFHNKKKVIIICKKHGEFSQEPNSHLSGYGCPICNSSKGEMKILEFLQKNNIVFKSQKTFSDCLNPDTYQRLKFDFYVPNRNLLIEYDGEQHFRIGDFGSFKYTMQDLQNLQSRDKIKTEYAIKEHISLIRIKYTDMNKIGEILTKTFGPF